jgi:hypothetical protein
VKTKWQTASNKWICHHQLIISWQVNSWDTSYSSTTKKARKRTKAWTILNTKKWYSCTSKRSKGDGTKEHRSKTNMYSLELLIKPKIFLKMNTKHWRTLYIKIANFKNKKYFHKIFQNKRASSLKTILRKYSKIIR